MVRSKRQSLAWQYRRLALLGAAAINLSACQMPVAQDFQADTQGRMRDLAARYMRDQEAGMAGIIGDVEDCYASGSPSRNDIYALRDCFILDAVGFREDSRFDRILGIGNLPYYQERTRAARWSHYGRLAGFGDTEYQVLYMVKGAALVETEIRKMRGSTVPPQLPQSSSIKSVIRLPTQTLRVSLVD